MKHEYSDTHARFMSLVLCLILTILLCRTCGGSVITEELLNTIKLQESGGNPNAVGKLGELGAWQLRSVAVQHINQIYGWRWNHRDVVRMDVGRNYALAYLQWLEGRLQAALHRPPSISELIRAYRFGLRGSLRNRHGKVS